MKKLLFALLVTTAPLLVPLSAGAASYYPTGPNLQDGMLVSSTANQGVVEPANSQNAASLLGILGGTNDDLSQQAGQVAVQSSGEVSALVSTLNGPIAVGDLVAPSSVQGIGAKSSGPGWVIGTAQGTLDSKTAGAVASTVTDTSGGKHQVYIAHIPLVVHVSYVNDQTGQNSEKASTVQTFADKLAGKHASELGILLSFIILFVGLVIVGLAVNSTIRGGFIAISRQPLIRSYLMRTILQSFAIAGLVMLAVFGAAYMLLRTL